MCSYSIKFKVLILSSVMVLSSTLYAGFTNINAGLQGVNSGSLSWGDYDNDGDLDLALAGNNSSKIYRNNNNAFADINAGLAEIWSCSLSWGDYDNDGDLDLAIAGASESGYVVLHRILIYRNNDGAFADIGVDLPGADDSSLSWGDYDNDGDLDLALAGDNTLLNTYLSKIYRNNAGTFSDIGADLDGVRYASLSWGDYDNDGDLDLAIAGANRTIYRNNGGTFTDSGAELQVVSNGCLSWGDYDNDGDLDLALVGGSGIAVASFAIYRNDGNNFVNSHIGDFSGVCYGSLSWGDYDNDGDLDLALAGTSVNSTGTLIYRNDSSTFADIGAGLQGIDDGSLSWGDYNNDGDLDLALAGSGYSIIYRNDDTIQNALPNPPMSGFNTNYNSTTGTLELRWGNGTDSETPSDGLYYEVRVSTTPINANTSSWVVAAPVGKGVGSCPQQTIGNYPHGKVSATQCGANLIVPNAKYYWQVRTIDTGLGKSNWSAVQVQPTLSPSGIDSIKIFPNPFTPKRHTYMTFDNLTTDAEIKIYTITGELVKTVDYTTQNGQAKWDGKNDSGKSVASGVYIALIKSQSQTKKIKFAVEK